ncbi:hybrid sensor histidine kinase/response regulator [Geomonas propionica]|uniref:histidine kinase n=1 Tax=Geomonas propionica TaxID=2798582 RepID=A0ABS0YTK9_9BACT|nr:ATP-binding protein [Geomonas propionica]MBJ6801092.1 response regulator [Geomonas propionica]
MNRLSLPQRFRTFRSSFQFKLFLRFTLFSAVIAVVCGTLFVLHQIRQNKSHAVQMLQLQAHALADAVRLPLYAESTELLQAHAADTMRLPGIRAVEIVSARGKVLVRLPASLPYSREELLSQTAEVHGHPLSLSPEQILAGEQDAPGDLVGEVRLYRGTADLWREGRRLAALSLVLATVCWLFVSLSCYLILRRVTASFNTLMRGLEKVHGGDYVSRIDIVSDDEPGRASASLNGLAESLWQREQENRRLHAELMAAMDFEIASKEQLVSVNLHLEQEIEQGTQARQELKNLVQQLPLGIVWSDEQGEIEYLNSFMMDTFGYGPEQAPDLDVLFALICPDAQYREAVLEKRRAAIAAWEQGNQATFYEMSALCRDGSPRQLNCSNQRSGARIVDIMIDMTERELLQQQMVRNQKLESIGVLAGGIAHNFNNALTGVLGYISFAKKFLDPGHGSHELLQQAEKATMRAAGLANQLLSFAKGGAPLRKGVPVAALVEESVQFATKGTNVSAKIELPTDLPPVFVDDGQMRQAFNCICINAVQAMPEGGRLTVRGRLVSGERERLPAPLCGSYVELSFRDEGSGIRDEHKSSIFTPYFTTKAQLGTGLGLATVHSIVTRHGGVISFDSQWGRGTTFTLYLPVFGAESVVAQHKPYPPAQAGRGNAVLVMDDEEMIRSLAAGALSEQGYQVTVCASGQEAVELYQQALDSGAPFLAAVLDLTVPGGMGGKEAAQKILARDPGACLIVSSGYSNDVVMQDFHAYGFCAATVKPYNPDLLCRLLDALRQG